tara:strand:+ start:861 stop:3377 length:2517 start_codon:yes stop_codon:yes gene_type:complete
MSISKRATYVSPVIVNDTPDKVRSELNAYWVTVDQSQKNMSAPQMYYLAKNESATKRGNLTGFALSEEKTNDNTQMPVKRVSMRIYGNPTTFKNQRHWQAFVNGGRFEGRSFTPLFDKNQKFLDYTFTVDEPLTLREAAELGGNTRIKTCNVNLEYNFYQKEYEEMQGIITDEKLLPNLYALYSMKEGDEATRRNQIFRTHVSLASRLSSNDVQKFTDKASENPLVSNSGEYLRKFSKVIKTGNIRGNRADALSRVTRAYRNIMLSPSSTSILAYNEKRRMFPMYGEITFGTDKTTQFTQILTEANLSAVFMKDLYGSHQGAINWASQMQDFTTQMVIPVETKNELGTSTMVTKVSSQKTQAKVWDVLDWYNHFKQSHPSRMTSGIFIGQENREIEMATTGDFGFYKKMLETIFIGKVRTLVKNQQRRFADILDGDSCYSEELFYKIEKYVGQAVGDPIQTFWLANTNEIDVYNFIDSQVKYGTQYSYKATAYNMVIGSRYTYSNPSVTRRISRDCVEFTQGDEPVAPRVPGFVEVNAISGQRKALQVPRDQRFMAEVDVTISPYMFVVETPFFTHTSRLIDDPPLAPEVDILPYRTDSRFLKFFMQATSGQHIMEPVIITNTDQRIIDEIRQAKNLHYDDPITYTSDDHPAFFQLYRMTQPPREYKDFQGFLRKTVSTDISEKTPQTASGIAYVDQIRPNTKYYYMFRSIDVHNKTGAPSPVYEIEMVYDKGAFYPVIRIHELGQTPDVTETKTGRRFIQIIPNIEQTLINEDKSGFDEFNSAKDVPAGRITYGYSEDSVWNKKFKVRLTSTKTGKKIDINVRFKTKRVKTDLEESS